MRYKISIAIGPEDTIPKDKNRMVLSFLKHALAESDGNFYDKTYVKGLGARKDFTYSLYMKDAKFLRDTIVVPDRRLILNFSCNDMMMGIQFYNAMIKSVRKEYVYQGEFKLHTERVELAREEIFTSDTAIFKTMSPIVIREHDKSKNKDWFYSIDEDKGRAIFLENLKYQIVNSIPEAAYDIENIEVRIIKNKTVKVKHYGIEILSNICKMEMKAKPYILEYLYKAGIGSMKNTGFGLLTVD